LKPVINDDGARAQMPLCGDESSCRRERERIRAAAQRDEDKRAVRNGVTVEKF
jgi:hypothetical protein